MKLDFQAVIDNSPEKTGGVADQIKAAWAARAARYAEGRLARKRAQVATELAEATRDA